METTEIINGYSITGEWRNGQRGRTASATKGGKKYFLKKYTKFVLPTDDGMFDAKTIKKKKDDFDDFVRIRRIVLARLKPIAGPGGNIVIPSDNFVSGLNYYEATEFIDGVVPDDEMKDFFASLSNDEKMLMMKTAAGALSAVHSAGVIHSDLKIKNIIVVKNGRNNFVAKLIDFDSSYPDDEKKYIGGDDAYCSPELFEYSNSEDDDEMETLVKKISNKTDIFSLGLCFHYYLSQEYPEAVELSERFKKQKMLKERAGKTAIFYASQLLLDGCELKLSDKITSVNIKSIIYDMLSTNPEKRPRAMQVLTRLKESEPTIEAPWPEHGITFDSGKISSAGIAGIRKIKDGEAKYEIIYFSGKKSIQTKDELVSLGYAKNTFVPKGFEDIWPEHCIVFDKEKLLARGFVSETKETLAGKKGYKLYRSDGSGSFFPYERLTGLGYVRVIGDTEPTTVAAPSIRVEPSKVELWPEHSIKFDDEMVAKKGFISVEKGEMSGVKGYFFTRIDGKRQFIRVEMILNQKLAHRI